MSTHLENQTAGCCHVMFKTFNRVHWLIVSNDPNTHSLTSLNWYNYSRISCCLRLTANSCCGSFGSLKLLLCPFSLGAVYQTVWSRSSYNFKSWIKRWSSPSSSPFQNGMYILTSIFWAAGLHHLMLSQFWYGQNSPQNFPQLLFICVWGPCHLLTCCHGYGSSPTVQVLIPTKQQFF